MWNGLSRISRKTQDKLPAYNALVKELRELSGNRSELSGDTPDFRGLSPHHITGRIGKKLTDVFNILIVTADEHTYLQKHMSYQKKQELLGIVKAMRIKQGYRE